MADDFKDTSDFEDELFQPLPSEDFDDEDDEFQEDEPSRFRYNPAEVFDDFDDDEDYED